MELDDIVVTKLFDVMTIPIAKGTKRPIEIAAARHAVGVADGVLSFHFLTLEF